jgi:tRNA-splicing ligase RtcB
VKQIITSENKPIKLWLDNIEQGALEQAKNIANLPFTFRHVALMPDAHQGFGMPIGGVLATKDVIIPNAVGVDIGCGMCAVKTSLDSVPPKLLKKLMTAIRQQIPFGFKHHKKEQDHKLMPDTSNVISGGIVEQEYRSALTQIGTLGGGNHFIEIQQGSEGHIWIMIHSGSRNIGLKVASHYNRLAKKLNEKWKSKVPPNWQLAFLPDDVNEAKNYFSEMQYCIDFAYANRKLMMDRIKDIFNDEFGSSFLELEFVNIAHNYAQEEDHFGEKVIVHRKGATSAREGETGIIPGSQGTKSYIVKGKGNQESFTSCSHGAGRKMGRKEAQRSLDLEQEKKQLDKQGIIHAIRNTRDLDEAPGAYKNIDIVMENQKDLVEVQVELAPLAVMKG